MGLLIGVVRPQVGVWFLGVFLLIFARLWILVTEDEVQLVVLATLVRSEHDGVRGLVHKLVLDSKRHTGLTQRIKYKPP